MSHEQDWCRGLPGPAREPLHLALDRAVESERRAAVSACIGVLDALILQTRGQGLGPEDLDFLRARLGEIRDGGVE